MQSSEALVFRIRRVFFRNTLHHDHHVDPGHPAIVAIMENFNKLLRGLACAIFQPGDLATKRRAEAEEVDDDHEGDEREEVGPDPPRYNPHHWIARLALTAAELPLHAGHGGEDPTVVNVGGPAVAGPAAVAAEAGPAEADTAPAPVAPAPRGRGGTVHGGARGRGGASHPDDDDDDDDDEPQPPRGKRGRGRGR